MAKPYRWTLRVPEILDDLEHRSNSYWSRSEIEHTFQVGRTAAADIMKAIGHEELHGVQIMVREARIKQFLVAANREMDTAVGKAARAAKLSSFMKKRKANARVSQEHAKKLIRRVPHATTIADLPKQIRLSQREIHIRFEDAVEAVNLVYKLWRAICFDMQWFVVMCDPNVERVDLTF